MNGNGVKGGASEGAKDEHEELGSFEELAETIVKQTETEHTSEEEEKEEPN